MAKPKQFTTLKLQPCQSLKVSTYEVTVVHMHGDADNYTTDVHDFDSSSEMLDFVNFIYRCMALYPHGMGGDDGYWKVEGYDQFGDYLHQDNEVCDGHATPETPKVVYYDAQSVKWDAKLIK